MTTIASVGFAADSPAVWRGVEDIARAAPARNPAPVIIPPAVILPRTAAWLNPQPSDADAAPAATPAQAATAAPSPAAPPARPVLQLA